jgi:hypothetical protein
VDIHINYTPQPKQAQLHESPANEILYGGAAGPGKSHALRFEALMWCLRIPNLHVYLFRRIFPELEKNHIIPSLEMFPKEIGTYKDQKRRWEIHNGSMLHFCHCQYENDVFNYQGAEIHLLLIDELTTFTELQYDYLRGRVRCALDINPKYKHKIPGIVTASNPGGCGHEFAKRRWVTFTKSGTIPFRRASKREGGMLRQYIPGKLEDNPILTERDPDYIHRLDALPEPFRTAYKEGDWDIFIGQAFQFNKLDHVIPHAECPFVPDNAPIYMTMDWGFGAPFSIGWWWVDADDRIYRFAEWYGWNGTPDQGIRWEDSRIAEEIIKKETELGIALDRPTRLAGHDCWNKKPDYKGSGQGPPTAEVFAQYRIFLNKADSTREVKIRAFRERLKIPDDRSRPLLMVYEQCEHFIRTIPLLQMDITKPEDINTKMEDHVYDEACHIAMARPTRDLKLKTRPSETDRRLEDLEKTGKDPLTTYQDVAEREAELMDREFQGDPFAYGDEYDFEEDYYDTL